jgi:hypothetical protein
MAGAPQVWITNEADTARPEHSTSGNRASMVFFSTP